MNTKWAFGSILVMAMMTSFASFADDGSDENHEARIRLLEKRLAEVDAIVKALIPPVTIRPCTGFWFNPRHAPVGLKCRTRMGAIYERVEKRYFGEAWKGPDGLIYSDRIESTSFNYARKSCSDRGGRLPDEAEIKRAAANGFQEVLPHLHDRTFWTSSGSTFYGNIILGSDNMFDKRFPEDGAWSFRCVSK